MTLCCQVNSTVTWHGFSTSTISGMPRKMFRRDHSAQNFAWRIPEISSGFVTPTVVRLATSRKSCLIGLFIILTLHGPVRLNFSNAMIEKTLQAISGSFSMLFKRQSHTASENRVELISPVSRLASTLQINATVGLFFFLDRSRASPPSAYKKHKMRLIRVAEYF